MTSRDSLSSGVLVLFAVVVALLSRRLGLWTPDGPGDGLFPFLAAICLGVLGVTLCVRSLRARMPAGRARPSIDRTKLLTYLAGVLAYPLLFERLGFVLTTFAFLLVVCRGGERVGWTRTLLIAGIGTASSFLVFAQLLAVPLPAGVLRLVLP